MASLAKAATVHQPRTARLTTIFQTARVTTGSRDHLCRVRDISTGGMRLETLAPVDVGQPIDIELKNGLTMRGEVAWVGQSEAGIRFDGPADITQMLAPRPKSGSATSVRVVRPPRLSAQCAVALRHNGRVVPGILTDISQGGAQLQSAGSMRVEDYVVLLIPGLDTRRAVVRRVTADGVGIAFVDKLGFDELAQWLSGPERFARGAAPVVNRTLQSSGSTTLRPVPSRPQARRK